MNSDKRISRKHGSGGKKMNQLIESLVKKYFHGSSNNFHDFGTVSQNTKGRWVMSTDSFVVYPLFFPGGDIGKLAACGTINDISTSGRKPQAMTFSVIVEEGFQLECLEKIFFSFSEVISQEDIPIISGDFKVVESGAAQGIFLNTTGLGFVEEKFPVFSPSQINNGDEILVTGNLGNHEAVLMGLQYEMEFEDLISDCAPLGNFMEKACLEGRGISCMRDPTRGGISAVLHEISHQSQKEILLYEKDIPFDNSVKDISRLLGMDPLHFACEGRMVLFVSPEYSDEILSRLKKYPEGKDSCKIGMVTSNNKSRVILRTIQGVDRTLLYSEGSGFPRIC